MEDVLRAIAAALEALHAGLAGSLSVTPPASGEGEPVAKRRWRVTTKAPTWRDGKFWSLRYYPPPGQGKPHQKTTRLLNGVGATTEEEATALARAEEARLNSECLPFAEVATRYCDFRAGDGETRSSSVQRYREATRCIARALRGREVSPETIIAVQDELRGTLAATTLNRGRWGRATTSDDEGGARAHPIWYVFRLGP